LGQQALQQAVAAVVEFVGAAVDDEPGVGVVQARDAKQPPAGRGVHPPVFEHGTCGLVIDVGLPWVGWGQQADNHTRSKANSNVKQVDSKLFRTIQGAAKIWCAHEPTNPDARVDCQHVLTGPLGIPRYG